MKTYKFTLTTIAEIKADTQKEAENKYKDLLLAIHNEVYYNKDIECLTYDSLEIKCDDDDKIAYDAEKIDYSRID